jgi:small subunit ribosomal protein S18
MANNLTSNKFTNINNEDSDTTESIDFGLLTYKDTKSLSNFISDQGKILPRRVTGLSSKQQKKVTKLIKTARIAALLPFVVGKG